MVIRMQICMSIWESYSTLLCIPIFFVWLLKFVSSSGRTKLLAGIYQLDTSPMVQTYNPITIVTDVNAEVQIKSIILCMHFMLNHCSSADIHTYYSLPPYILE